MSNLGMYQTITTLAKKVGGPKKLIILTMGAGYVVFRSGEAVVKKAVKETVKIVKSKNGKTMQSVERIFDVISNGKSDGGLELNVGDKYRILETDGEAILIEKIGDPNSPYFVSADFLQSVSNFVS
ncbi:hypothetical protein D7X33_22495 [Butyricicoccus sp. 1XD8-22]|nr:hypothetical protein D7X33_22495 [Butyricicoccus sp. 1XD8-22]